MVHQFLWKWAAAHYTYTTIQHYCEYTKNYARLHRRKALRRICATNDDQDIHRRRKTGQSVPHFIVLSYLLRAVSCHFHKAAEGVDGPAEPHMEVLHWLDGGIRAAVSVLGVCHEDWIPVQWRWSQLAYRAGLCAHKVAQYICIDPETGTTAMATEFGRYQSLACWWRSGRCLEPRRIGSSDTDHWHLFGFV